jgi:hypothetical protein
LATSFDALALDYARTIIQVRAAAPARPPSPAGIDPALARQELVLPLHARTVRPDSVGGIAGGVKFTINGACGSVLACVPAAKPPHATARRRHHVEVGDRP